ncbi:hypothetical protein HJ581_0044095 [Rhodococcus opacus]|nr:hypothetical protein HJ581_0044095 [Rhodococcus opacus]
MPRTGATLSHGQITAVLRKTGRRDIEAETVLSRGPGWHTAPVTAPGNTNGLGLTSSA